MRDTQHRRSNSLWQTRNPKPLHKALLTRLQKPYVACVIRITALKSEGKN